MNNIVRAMIELPTGSIKAAFNDIFYGAKIALKCAISPNAEISIRRGGEVKIGSNFRARGGVKYAVGLPED